MKSTSVLRTVGAVAALALGLSACTGTTSNDGDGDVKNAKSLRYLLEQPEDPKTLQKLEDRIGEFEKESGIDVKVEALPLDSMRSVVQTQLRSGDGPDVFSWGSGPGYAGALAKAGLLYDLSDAYDKFDWKIYDFAKERVTFDGKTFGVPGEMETIGIYYNKDIFTDKGLEPPTTMAELETVAQELEKDDIVPLAVSDKEGWQGGHLLSMALSSSVGADKLDALLKGEESWDSPEVVSALEDLQKLHKSGYLPESPTSVTYDAGNAMFFSGKAAMVPTGSWLVTELDANVKFDVGFVPWPGKDGEGIFTGGLGSGPFISATTKKTDAALELVDFLASPEHAQWNVEEFSVIPPQPVDAEAVDASPLFEQVLETTAKLADGSAGFGHNIDVLATDQFNEEMWDGVQAILSDQADPEDVASDLEAAFKK